MNTPIFTSCCLALTALHGAAVPGWAQAADAVAARPSAPAVQPWVPDEAAASARAQMPYGSGYEARQNAAASDGAQATPGSVSGPGEAGTGARGGASGAGAGGAGRGGMGRGR